MVICSGLILHHPSRHAAGKKRILPRGMRHLPTLTQGFSPCRGIPEKCIIDLHEPFFAL